MNIVTDKWLQVEMKADKTATIKIHGVIGGGLFAEGVTDSQVEQDLQEIAKLNVKSITVDLDSLGGSVKHGMKIYNLLKENPAEIKVKITGWTASMGTVIAMASDKGKLSMVDNAFFLIHEARTISMGTQSQLYSDAKTLADINKQVVSIYANRTGVSESKIRNLMAINGGEGEFWTAKEAKQKGFIDSIYKPAVKAAAIVTDKQLENLGIYVKPKNKKMKINLKKVQDLTKDVFKAMFGKIEDENKTEEVITEAVEGSMVLVVDELQKQIDDFKAEKEKEIDALKADYDNLKTDYDKINAGNPQPKKDNDRLNDEPLSEADKAAKRLIDNLSDTEKILLTKEK